METSTPSIARPERSAGSSPPRVRFILRPRSRTDWSTPEAWTDSSTPSTARPAREVDVRNQG
jgi:hypothetical protein